MTDTPKSVGCRSSPFHFLFHKLLFTSVQFQSSARQSIRRNKNHIPRKSTKKSSEMSVNVYMTETNERTLWRKLAAEAANYQHPHILLISRHCTLSDLRGRHFVCLTEIQMSLTTEIKNQNCVLLTLSLCLACSYGYFNYDFVHKCGKIEVNG